jgi:peptidoglycan hydrolase-like protein with peptidoglycan-binding domain
LRVAGGGGATVGGVLFVRPAIPLVRVGAVALAIILILVALPAIAPAQQAPRGRGMWVWYVSRSAGGSVPAIAAQARAAGVDGVYVKAADGTHVWSQFSPSLVASLHSAGLRVCAWQYVYGAQPVLEARAALVAVRDGADCLIIDAEIEYEGRYAAAQAYLRALRAVVGPHYPLALASFPYVDFHPAFPYSVFLGPGGAQFDMPQMYWGDIGDSVGRVYSHTYSSNRIYRRPIVPLGQSDGAVSLLGVQRFRGLALSYGAPGIAWWDFAWASASALWPAIGAPVGPAGAASHGYPVLRAGSRGDDVVLLQEHLAGVFPLQRLTGLFGDQTRTHLEVFQRTHGLPVTGVTTPRTWRAVLRLHRVDVTWASSAHAARAGSDVVSPPASASLGAVRREIPELGSSHSARGEGSDP